MNREILFRGKCPRNEKWIEGDVIFQSQSTVIRRRSDAMCFEVDPSTVCQYTGLTDAEGNKIWENDIIETEPHEYDIGIIRYGKYITSCGYNDVHIGFYVDWQRNTKKWRKDLGYWAGCRTVTGNVFDNPELLEGRMEEE